jgi:hypothetical protein
VDISLDSVRYARAEFSSQVPRALRDTVTLQSAPLPMLSSFDDIARIRNRQDPNIKYQTDVDTSLRDFYWRYARGLERIDTATKYPIQVPGTVEPADPASQQQLSSKHFYELSFSNKGGLVMPIIIEWTYRDGSKEVERIPAQVWRLNENKVTKFFMKDKEVTGIRIDPLRETADINEGNNTWGNVIPTASRFQVFKARQAAARGQSTGVNPMQKAQGKL